MIEPVAGQGTYTLHFVLPDWTPPGVSRSGLLHKCDPLPSHGSVEVASANTLVDVTVNSLFYTPLTAVGRTITLRTTPDSNIKFWNTSAMMAGTDWHWAESTFDATKKSGTTWQAYDPYAIWPAPNPPPSFV